MGKRKCILTIILVVSCCLISFASVQATAILGRCNSNVYMRDSSTACAEGSTSASANCSEIVAGVELYISGKYKTAGYNFNTGSYANTSTASSAKKGNKLEVYGKHSATYDGVTEQARSYNHN